MVTIKKFVFNPFSENTYVVFDENNTAVIIDPGMYNSEEEKIKQKCVKQKKHG